MGYIMAYVVGSRPFYMHIKAFAMRLWKPTCSLEVDSREKYKTISVPLIEKEVDSREKYTSLYWYFFFWLEGGVRSNS